MTFRERKNGKDIKRQVPRNPLRRYDIRRILGGAFLLFLVVIAGCMAVMIKDCLASARGKALSAADQKSGCILFSGDFAAGTQSDFSSSDGTNGESSSYEASVSVIETEKDPDADSGKDSKSAESMTYIPLSVEPSKTMETLEHTISFVQHRIPFLQDAMRDNRYCFSEKILDKNTGTTAYILAKNENCAQNLNAYFYYLFDTKPYTSVISPFVLNISTLFEQENRETVVDDGTFAQKDLLETLKQSLIAVLGSYYKEEIFTFIYSEYVRIFTERLNGDPLQTPLCKLQSDHIEVIFHNSFLTYVEFFMSP